MELDNVHAKPARNWLKYGLIGGGIGILFNVILYLVNEKLLMNQMVSLIPMLILLTLGVLAANAQKRENGGLLTYGGAVGTSWGTFAIGLLMGGLFGLLLYFVIDPSLMTMAKDMQIEKMDEKLASGKLTQGQYDAAVNYMQNMGSGMFVFFWIGALLLFCVLALVVFLITSIFIRKEPEL
jgi:hypothetical protein